MANKFTMIMLLGFKDFFPNEIPKSKEFYGQFLGRKLIQKYCCHFLSYYRVSSIPPIETFIKDWFTFFGHRYHQSPSYYVVETEYRRIKLHSLSKRHEIISVESLLNIYLWSLNAEIPEELETDASSTIRFFEFILLFNDEVLHNYEKVINSISGIEQCRGIQRLVFASSFSQSDLINIDYLQLFFTQIYKLAELLLFLSQNTQYTAVRDKLLHEFDCANTDDFIRAIASAAILSLGSKEPGWTILKIHDDDPHRNRSIRILENISISESESIQTEQDDYKPIRNKPFQRISESEYLVIFDLFLIKKIYNGTIFKLSSYDKNFLGSIRNDFSEATILYKVLERILPSISSIKITGNEFKAQKLLTEPDYYYRKDKSIILFESKDFFMKGQSKLSYDFNIIENELKYDSNTGKEDRLLKAVKQLATNIRRCLDKEIPKDSNYEVRDIDIFPVIIVHDSLYSAPGLNFWIDYWLKDEIEKMKQEQKYESVDFAKVQPLTIVEIDTLILYEEQFENSTFDFIESLNWFQGYVLYRSVGHIPHQYIEEHATRSALSFSEFIRNEAHRREIKISFERITTLLNKFGIQ